jgi:hypothetical protein
VPCAGTAGTGQGGRVCSLTGEEIRRKKKEERSKKKEEGRGKKLIFTSYFNESFLIAVYRKRYPFAEPEKAQEIQASPDQY